MKKQVPETVPAGRQPSPTGSRVAWSLASGNKKVRRPNQPLSCG